MLKEERPSLPPGDDSLAKVADHHRKRNDDHERLVRGLPTPLAIQIASIELTDEQLLAFCRRLWAFHNASGYIHVDQSLTAFEREARERIAKR